MLVSGLGFLQRDFAGYVFLQLGSVVFTALRLLAQKQYMVREFSRGAKANRNQGPLTISDHWIRLNQTGMAGEDHLRRGGIVAHADALQYSRYYLYQLLLGKGPVEAGMRPFQRPIFKDSFNNLAWLCNLASINPLSYQFMRMRAAKAVCLELVISSKSMAYVMRYSDFPH